MASRPWVQNAFACARGGIYWCQSATFLSTCKLPYQPARLDNGTFSMSCGYLPDFLWQKYLYWKLLKAETISDMYLHSVQIAVSVSHNISSFGMYIVQDLLTSGQLEGQLKPRFSAYTGMQISYLAYIQPSLFKQMPIGIFHGQELLLRFLFF